MQTQNADTQSIDAFFEELGLTGLSQDKKQEMFDKINEVILKKIFLATEDRLSGEQQKQLDELIEKKSDPKEIEAFLLEKISDYNEMVRTIVSDYKEELKKSVSKNFPKK